MTNFRVGQKVVCVSDNWYPMNRSKGPLPVKGEIYTIDMIGMSGALFLAEFHWTHYEYGRVNFAPYCFRPVDDTFGEVVAEIIEKQLELETVEA